MYCRGGRSDSRNEVSRVCVVETVEFMVLENEVCNLISATVRNLSTSPSVRHKCVMKVQ